jgi:conjugal transfer pilus assembly protein TraK
MIHLKPNFPAATLTSLFLLCAATSAHALQILDVSDGATVFVKISSNDITRLTINNGRIAAWQVPKGRLVLQKNAKTGDLYVRPLNRETPVSLFVTSESGGTYALTLQPISMPSETVVLRETGRAQPSFAERAGSRSDAIKAFMLAMAADRLPPDMEVKESAQDFELWQGSRLTLVRTWVGARWVGERFDLTNTGQSSMRLAEQELFKQGVLSIAIEKLELAPGETTRVFVLREARDES